MCDENSQIFKDLFTKDKANVDYDIFIRTTEQKHKEAVNHLWTTLQEKGYIVKGQHKGFYSTNEETFFMEKDLLKDQYGNMVVPHSGEVCELV